MSQSARQPVEFFFELAAQPRMGRLIEEILGFVRVGGEVKHLCPFGMAGVVNELGAVGSDSLRVRRGECCFVNVFVEEGLAPTVVLPSSSGRQLRPSISFGMGTPAQVEQRWGEVDVQYHPIDPFSLASQPWISHEQGNSQAFVVGGCAFISQACSRR